MVDQFNPILVDVLLVLGDAADELDPLFEVEDDFSIHSKHLHLFVVHGDEWSRLSRNCQRRRLEQHRPGMQSWLSGVGSQSPGIWSPSFGRGAW